jgi:hypothetical protein
VSELRVIDAAATRAALPFAQLIPALRSLFAGAAVVPARHVHQIESGGADAVRAGRVAALLPEAYREVRSLRGVSV